jgi:hypothetical protein
MLWDGFRSVDATQGFRLEQNYLITPRPMVEAGTDVIRCGGRARNIKTSLDYGDHHVSEGGVFSRAHFAASTALVLNAGFRFAG